MTRILLMAVQEASWQSLSNIDGTTTAEVSVVADVRELLARARIQRKQTVIRILRF
jgi:hypothetical protein